MNKLSFYVVLAVCFAHALADCDKLPANFDIDSCCKTPDVAEDVVMKVASLFKDVKLEGHMMECKLSEAVMKELKLSKDDGIDNDALLKFMDVSSTEPYWKAAGKSVGEQCMKEVTSKKDEIIKAFEKAPFNIKKDQCNPIYAYMTACISFEAFKKCPKEAWTESKNCSEIKSFMDKCEDKIAILSKM